MISLDQSDHPEKIKHQLLLPSKYCRIIILLKYLASVKTKATPL